MRQRSKSGCGEGGDKSVETSQCTQGFFCFTSGDMHYWPRTEQQLTTLVYYSSGTVVPVV